MITQIYKEINRVRQNLFLNTCNKVCVVELADGISLIPGDAVAEVAVEHREPLLWQDPRIADVHLHNNTRIRI